MQPEGEDEDIKNKRMMSLQKRWTFIIFFLKPSIRDFSREEFQIVTIN